MLFTLEALDAAQGDALLLHWGKPKEPRLMVIDGGPPGVWKSTLKPRLDQLRAALVGEAPLPIDLVTVSHIDGDHIAGLLDLTAELKAERPSERSYDVLELWHNGFETLLGDRAAGQTLAVAGGKPAAASFGVIAASLPLNAPAQAVVASVPQGAQLQKDAHALAWSVNSGFPGELVCLPAAGAAEKDLGEGLEVTVIGPSAQRIDALRKEWQKLRGRARPQDAAWSALTADFVDGSVYNLASIVLVAKAGGKTMLLTGDARGDDILAGLRAAELLKDGKAHFDLLKVPHHGSARNVTADFFRTVTADHYVISANGKDDNPDRSMLRMLTDARAGEKYTVHLTNAVPWAVEYLEGFRGKPALVLRDDSKPSLAVHLGQALPPKMQA